MEERGCHIYGPAEGKDGGDVVLHYRLNETTADSGVGEAITGDGNDNAGLPHGHGLDA